MMITHKINLLTMEDKSRIKSNLLQSQRFLFKSYYIDLTHLILSKKLGDKKIQINLPINKSKILYELIA